MPTWLAILKCRVGPHNFASPLHSFSSSSSSSTGRSWLPVRHPSLPPSKPGAGELPRARLSPRAPYLPPSLTPAKLPPCPTSHKLWRRACGDDGQSSLHVRCPASSSGPSLGGRGSRGASWSRHHQAPALPPKGGSPSTAEDRRRRGRRGWLGQRERGRGEFVRLISGPHIDIYNGLPSRQKWQIIKKPSL